MLITSKELSTIFRYLWCIVLMSLIIISIIQIFLNQSLIFQAYDLPKDFCSIKVITGTHQTGPRKKPTKESKTQESSVSSSFDVCLFFSLALLLPFLDIVLSFACIGSMIWVNVLLVNSSEMDYSRPRALIPSRARIIILKF